MFSRQLTIFVFYLNALFLIINNIVLRFLNTNACFILFLFVLLLLLVWLISNLFIYTFLNNAIIWINLFCITTVIYLLLM